MTEYTPHKNKTSRIPASPNYISEPASDSPYLPAISNEASLTAIESAPTEKINALSTSELAPILNSAHRRFRIAPFVLLVCLTLFVLAFNSNDSLYLGLAAVYATIFIPIFVFLDRYRRSTKIEYKLERTANIVAEALSESFSDLKACNAIWAIQAEGATFDWKRNAGATTLSKRKRIYPNFERPSCIRGNMSFPALKIGTEELYFLPDAVLILKSGSVAAIHYQDLVISNSKTRFIESETVPGDASIAGETWRFVNKSGGPDRRFNFNKRLPICLYGEMEFKSESGLNCKIQFSNPSAAKRLAKAIEILHRPESLIQSKPITSYQKAKNWPTIAFCCCLLFGGLVFAGLFSGRIALTEILSSVQSAYKLEPDPSSQPPQHQRPSTMPLVIPPGFTASGGTNQKSTLDIPLPRSRP